MNAGRFAVNTHDRSDEAELLAASWKDEAFLERKRQQRGDIGCRKEDEDSGDSDSDKDTPGPSQKRASSIISLDNGRRSSTLTGARSSLSPGFPGIGKYKSDIPSLSAHTSLPGIDEDNVDDQCQDNHLEVPVHDHLACWLVGVAKLKHSSRCFMSIDREGKHVDRERLDSELEEENTGQKEARTWHDARDQIWRLMTEPQSSNAAYVVSIVISFFIFLSSTLFCLDSIDSLRSVKAWAESATYIEAICVVLFTVEYLAKLISSRNICKFLRNPVYIIDLLAILPWYFEGLVNKLSLGQLPVLRVVRLVRILRVLKLGERYHKIQIVARSVRDSSDMLAVLLFLLTIAVIICSSLMYYLERGRLHEVYGYYVRPEDEDLIDPETGKPPESPFRSIPDTFWYCMVTLMTVGYGDVVPKSALGRMTAGFLMLISMLILALPISVIGTNFTTAWMEYKERIKTMGSTVVPENIENVKELLRKHLLNIDDLIKYFTHVEHTLENIRVQMNEKLKRGRVGVIGLEVSREPSFTPGFEGQVPPKAANPLMLNPKLASQWRREIVKMKQLEKKMNMSFEALDDLLKAATLMRSGGFSSKIKQTRMQFKQMEFLTEESEALRVGLRDLSADIHMVEASIAHLKHRSIKACKIKKRGRLRRLSKAIVDNIKHWGRLHNSVAPT